MASEGSAEEMLELCGPVKKRSRVIKFGGGALAQATGSEMEGLEETSPEKCIGSVEPQAASDRR